MFVDGPKVEVWRPPTSDTLEGGSWITSNWFERFHEGDGKHLLVSTGWLTRSDSWFQRLHEGDGKRLLVSTGRLTRSDSWATWDALSSSMRVKAAPPR